MIQKKDGIIATEWEVHVAFSLKAYHQNDIYIHVSISAVFQVSQYRILLQALGYNNSNSSKILLCEVTTISGNVLRIGSF